MKKLFYIIAILAISCHTLKLSTTSKAWIVDQRVHIGGEYRYRMHDPANKYYLYIALDSAVVINDTINIYDNKGKLILIK